MREKTAKIQETFAQNLRENRHKCGFTQVQLAEKAEISTNYLAMVELARYIPRVEIIERLANALNIEIYKLFITDPSPREELEQLRQDIVNEINQTVNKAIKQSFAEESKNQKKS